MCSTNLERPIGSLQAWGNSVCEGADQVFYGGGYLYFIILNNGGCWQAMIDLFP